MSHRLVVVAGVLVAAGVVVGFVRFTASDDEAELDPRAFCDLLDARPAIPELGTELIVFMQPYATDGQIDSARRAISDVLPESKVRWWSQEAALEEYSELFADAPEMVEMAAAADLPPSFRVSAPHGATVEMLDELRELEGVFRVDDSGLPQHAATSDVLSLVFLSRDPAMPALALSEDEDRRVGLLAFTWDVDIDPTVASGDTELESDLQVLAEGLASLADLEPPDTAVISATERVLAAYDELCIG